MEKALEIATLFQRQALGILVAPFNGSSHLFWLYGLTFVALAVLSWKFYYAGSEGWSPRKVLGWIFPRKVYSHPSAVVDYQIFVVNSLFLPFLMIAANVGTARLAHLMVGGMRGSFGAPEPFLEWSTASAIVVTFMLAMATDFATYVSHALHHKIPFIWGFHKLHHTAEVLTPVTLFRKHPVYDSIGALISVCCRAPMQALVVYVFIGELSELKLLGANFVYTGFRFAGANLRHSHIWLSWGPVLSRIFVSPAMHQIHHSTDPRHWNKNHGEIFALWDWMFGTLYIPHEREELNFGIGGDEVNEHTSLARAYWVPFRDAARSARNPLRRRPGPEPRKPRTAPVGKGRRRAATGAR